MTVYANNPAGGLHNTITALRSHISQQQQLMWQAWAAALQVPPDDLPELLRQLAIVYKMPAAIVSELDRVPETEYDRDFTMRWQGEVLGLLGSRLFMGDQAAQVVPSAVSTESLSSLEHCSYVLYRYRPQPDLTDQQREDIEAKVRDLEEAVRADPDMDGDLRIFLLFHAGQMSRALRDLPLRGRAALEDAFDQAVGAAQRRTDLTTRVKESPSAWEKFRDVMLVVAAALAIASTSLALPGQIASLEGPPPPAPPSVQIINQIPPQPDAPEPEASQHR